MSLTGCWWLRGPPVPPCPPREAAPPGGPRLFVRSPAPSGDASGPAGGWGSRRVWGWVSRVGELREGVPERRGAPRGGAASLKAGGEPHPGLRKLRQAQVPSIPAVPSPRMREGGSALRMEGGTGRADSPSPTNLPGRRELPRGLRSGGPACATPARPARCPRGRCSRCGIPVAVLPVPVLPVPTCPSSCTDPPLRRRWPPPARPGTAPAAPTWPRSRRPRAARPGPALPAPLPAPGPGRRGRGARPPPRVAPRTFRQWRRRGGHGTRPQSPLPAAEGTGIHRSGIPAAPRGFCTPRGTGGHRAGTRLSRGTGPGAGLGYPRLQIRPPGLHPEFCRLVAGHSHGCSTPGWDTPNCVHPKLYAPLAIDTPGQVHPKFAEPRLQPALSTDTPTMHSQATGITQAVNTPDCTSLVSASPQNRAPQARCTPGYAHPQSRTPQAMHMWGYRHPRLGTPQSMHTPYCSPPGLHNPPFPRTVYPRSYTPRAPCTLSSAPQALHTPIYAHPNPCPTQPSWTGDAPGYRQPRLCTL